MVKTMYIEGREIGKVLNFTYTPKDGGDEQPVVAIPCGNDEVVTTFNVKDPAEVARFMEAIRKVFPLRDAEIAKEFIQEGGELTPHATNFLNVVSVTYVNNGRALVPALMVFSDGSHLAWK